jgi:hypothetical protein
MSWPFSAAMPIILTKDRLGRQNHHRDPKSPESELTPSDSGRYCAGCTIEHGIEKKPLRRPFCMDSSYHLNPQMPIWVQVLPTFHKNHHPRSSGRLQNRFLLVYQKGTHLSREGHLEYLFNRHGQPNKSDTPTLKPRKIYHSTKVSLTLS